LPHPTQVGDSRSLRVAVAVATIRVLSDRVGRYTSLLCI
jgi:hypothetical protein